MNWALGALALGAAWILLFPQQSAGQQINPGLLQPGSVSPKRERLRPRQPSVVIIRVPLRDGKFLLGEVMLRINPDQSIDLEVKSLSEACSHILRDDLVQTLRTLTPEDGYVSVTVLRDRGFLFTFDAATLTMAIEPTIEQRRRGTVVLNSSGGNGPNHSNHLKRAQVSGYANFYGGATSSDGGPLSGTSISVEGAMRVLDFVIEGEATLAGGALMRRGTRAVYDDPDRALRFIGGDLSPATTGLQGGGSIFGVSVEKSYGKLQPQTSVRPTGQRSFRLERPADVDVLINGRTVRRLQLNAGDYDLNDLPLRSGQNDIELQITDESGQRRSLHFSLFFDRALLAPGVAEWGFAAGIESAVTSDGLTYTWERPALTGFYRTGLLEDLTAEFHGQADRDGAMAGVIATWPSALGLISGEIAASVGANGAAGFAATFDYYHAAPFSDLGLLGSLRFSAHLESAQFQRSFDQGNGGIARFNAQYASRLAENLSASLGGHLKFEADAETGWGVFASLTRTIRPDVVWSLSATYDETARDSVFGMDGLSVQGRLGIRLGKDSDLTVLHDAHSRVTEASARHTRVLDHGVVTVQGDVVKDPGVEDGEAENAVGFDMLYSGNRGNLAIDHQRRFQGLGSAGAEHTSSIRGSTGIAFADGAFGVGRPVSDSFAIIEPHPSLEGATVGVGHESMGTRPATGWLGNAVVPDLPAYVEVALPVTVTGAPAGYDVGRGIYTMMPHRRSGYVITVGSAYSVAAVGYLETAEGEPVTLVAGRAQENSGDPPKEIDLFTNRAGRFSAQGMRPGIWTVRMDSVPPTCFTLAVPDEARGYVDAGRLRPSC